MRPSLLRSAPRWRGAIRLAIGPRAPRGGDGGGHLVRALPAAGDGPLFLLVCPGHAPTAPFSQAEMFATFRLIAAITLSGSIAGEPEGEPR